MTSRPSPDLPTPILQPVMQLRRRRCPVDIGYLFPRPVPPPRRTQDLIGQALPSLLLLPSSSPWPCQVLRASADPYPRCCHLACQAAAGSSLVGCDRKLPKLLKFTKNHWIFAKFLLANPNELWSPPSAEFDSRNAQPNHNRHQLPWTRVIITSNLII